MSQLQAPNKHRPSVHRFHIFASRPDAQKPRTAVCQDRFVSGSPALLRDMDASNGRFFHTHSLPMCPIFRRGKESSGSMLVFGEVLWKRRTLVRHFYDSMPERQDT
jgi:hypothetical protein